MRMIDHDEGEEIRSPRLRNAPHIFDCDDKLIAQA
jgi:hypothetical protein